MVGLEELGRASCRGGPVLLPLVKSRVLQDGVEQLGPAQCVGQGEVAPDCKRRTTPVLRRAKSLPNRFSIRKEAHLTASFVYLNSAGHLR